MLPSLDRVCVACGVPKPPDAYPVNKRLPSGHESRCLACHHGGRSQARASGKRKMAFRARVAFTGWGRGPAGKP